MTAQVNPEQQKVLHRYITWHLVRRLRQRNNGHPTTTQPFASVRQRTYGAVAFLSWLAALELTRGSCRQADLDR